MLGGGNPLKKPILLLTYSLELLHTEVLIKTFDHQKFIKGDVQNMDFFSDKEVDFLFTQQTLEHVNDPEKALSEIIRVAKRGFIDVLAVPQKCIWGILSIVGLLI